MKNENSELISARIRELIETSKGKGAITLKEITEQFSDCEIEPEQARLLRGKKPYTSLRRTELYL